jgi:hypothetical protein
MNLADLASIGSFINGVAVLISLIYLALQTRQNVRHTLALIEQGRSSQVSDRTNCLALNPEIAEIYLNAARGGQALTDLQIFRLISFQFGLFINFEDQFYQHERRLLDEDAFKSMLAGLKVQARNIGARTTWKVLRGNWEGLRFQKFVDDVMASEAQITGGPQIAVAAWRTFASAEGARARPEAAT